MGNFTLFGDLLEDEFFQYFQNDTPKFFWTFGCITSCYRRTRTCNAHVMNSLQILAVTGIAHSSEVSNDIGTYCIKGTGSLSLSRERENPDRNSVSTMHPIWISVCCHIKNDRNNYFHPYVRSMCLSNTYKCALTFYVL